MGAEKVTIHTLQQMKASGEKICMLTAYDATFAKLLATAGVDVLLVGDSLGMVVQGRENTLGVTVEEMIYHCRAVSRAAGLSHVVGDMPFMSYHASVEDAVRNAGRLVAEGKAEAVKLEGGEEFAETISAIVRVSIPVMGHIGLTPQSIHRMGGFKVQGRTIAAARQLMRDAIAVERAGAYAIVLEGMPLELAREITATLKIPTIGIGAGPYCDGQVLVVYDVLGMDRNFSPRFVKRYAELSDEITMAAGRYISEVKAGEFPTKDHSFLFPGMDKSKESMTEAPAGIGEGQPDFSIPPDNSDEFWP